MICRDFKKAIKLEMIGDNRYLAISVITGGKKKYEQTVVKTLFCSDSPFVDWEE